jgi:CheY-like chemotaxis protein/anti-sigma regulatory factor (Ser/Thr protein kinase)
LREVLEIGRTGEDLEECMALLSDSVSAADAIARVVKDLTVFARQDDEGPPSVIDLTALLDQVLRMVGRHLRTVAAVELDYPSDSPIVIAPSARLAQVFTNLLLNATHALEEHPADAHRVRISVRADEEAVAVSISDTGPGIAPDVIERIFDPFFTTKGQKQGTGLGLSISRSILQRLGGDLLVESVHGQGATFIALIPAPDREAVLEAWRGTRTKALVDNTEPDHCRLLVVDDDERVLRSFARSLDDRHTLLLARDAAEALALLDSGSHADVVVADSSPPTRAGVTLVEELRVRNSPLAHAVVLVVNPDEESDAAVVACGRPILTKPVDRASLSSAVTEALKRYPPGARPPGSTLEHRGM